MLWLFKVGKVGAGKAANVSQIAPDQLHISVEVKERHKKHISLLFIGYPCYNPLVSLCLKECFFATPFITTHIIRAATNDCLIID